MVGLDDPASDGQAKAGATSGCAGGFAPECEVEYLFQVRLGNPTALVGHRHIHPLIPNAGLDPNGAVAGRVADGVVEQVPQHPCHFGRGEVDVWSRPVELTFQPDASGPSGHGRGRDRVGYQIAKRHSLQLQTKGSRVDHRKLEQLIDEVGKALGLDAQC